MNRKFKPKKKLTWDSFSKIVSNGAAFFTIVSGLISVITLCYLYNQYKTSLKPDIIINDSKAAMIAERYNTNGYIHYIFANDSIDRKQLLYNAYTSGSSYIISPVADFNTFTFSLTNVGLGVAKNIKLSWHFDTVNVIQIFKNNPILYLDSVKFEKSTFIFFDKEGENYYSELRAHFDDKINYVLPISNSKETVVHKLPYLYLRLYSAYSILSNFIQSKSNLQQAIKGEFPPLYLKLSYSDIGNNNYEKVYVINISNGNSSNSEFQLNMIKIVHFEEVPKLF